MIGWPDASPGLFEFAVFSEWRQFKPEVILLAVGCYLRFSLSYRDVEELLGPSADFWSTTLPSGGLVQRYAPELEPATAVLAQTD